MTRTRDTAVAAPVSTLRPVQAAAVLSVLVLFWQFLSAGRMLVGEDAVGHGAGAIALHVTTGLLLVATVLQPRDDGGALVAGFSRTLSALAPSLAGVVTVLQSSRIVRLPIVQGPTAAFFAALLAAGAAYGLDVAFGSMIDAGLIFMALTIPVGRFGVLIRDRKRGERREAPAQQDRPVRRSPACARAARRSASRACPARCRRASARKPSQWRSAA